MLLSIDEVRTPIVATIINGIAEPLSPNAYTVAREIQQQIDALNAKDSFEVGEVVVVLQNLLVKVVEALARVEIEAGTASGRITKG
jgi:electron transfer flavoprotein alpha/beta subunit